MKKHLIKIDTIKFKNPQPILESKLSKENIKLTLEESGLTQDEISRFIQFVLEDLNQNKIRYFKGKLKKVN